MPNLEKQAYPLDLKFQCSPYCRSLVAQKNSSSCEFVFCQSISALVFHALSANFEYMIRAEIFLLSHL